jgi:hypothetical protein
MNSAFYEFIKYAPPISAFINGSLGFIFEALFRLKMVSKWQACPPREGQLDTR